MTDLGVQLKPLSRIAEYPNLLAVSIFSCQSHGYVLACLGLYHDSDPSPSPFPVVVASHCKAF